MSKMYFAIFLSAVLSSSSTAQIYKSIKVIPNSYRFELGENRGVNSTQNQFDEKNNLFIRSVQSPVNSLEVYDSNTGKLKKTVNSREITFDTFTKTSEGNYWVYDNWKKSYYLIDESVKVLKAIKAPERLNIDLLSVGGKFNPLIVFDNYLISTGLFLFRNELNTKSVYYKNSGVVQIINTNDQKTSYEGKITPLGQKNFYGNANSYSYTRNGNSLVVAPYFSDEIQIIDLKRKEVKFHILKNNFTNLINPLSPIEQFNKFTNAQNNDYTTKYPFLIGIVYDKYRGIYYRFVVEPENENPSKLKNSIYILNKDFKVLFYYNIPIGYSPANYFIDKKGLNILNKKTYQLNNKFLVYDLLKIQ